MSSVSERSLRSDQNFWLMRGRRGNRRVLRPQQEFFAVRGKKEDTKLNNDKLKFTRVI